MCFSHVTKVGSYTQPRLSVGSNSFLPYVQYSARAGREGREPGIGVAEIFLFPSSFSASNLPQITPPGSEVKIWEGKVLYVGEDE